NGNWHEYCEILEQFFIVNDVTTEVKKRVLLSCIGHKAYTLLRDLSTRVLPSTKSYAELTLLLSKHLNPKPLIIGQRFKFYNYKQKSSESISQYVASLQKLTEF